MAATRKLLIPLLFIASCGDSHEGGLSQVDATPSLPGLCATGPSTCSDEGRTECVDGGLRTCNEVAGCLQWGVVVACAPGSICVAPDDVARCVGSCDDEACTVPEARRCAPGDARAFQRCTDDDHDGCLGWSAAADCPSGETCGQGGFCADACADECAAGAKRCEGNGVVTCGQHDGDACVEWGEPEPCDHACALGACVDTCRDECAADGIRRCDGAAVDVCQGGADGCRHWVAAESCAPGTTCSAGACAAECVDECAAGRAPATPAAS
ncbi:MAG: hypothetical protein U1F43_14820 [Myxococcota bacterium]